jgi:hypothetical protein
MTEIKPLLSKQYWVRRTPGTETLTPTSMSAGPGEFEMIPDTPSGIRMNQTNFMNELHSSAHRIHSCSYRSFRPIYSFNETTQEHYISGYEDVERVDIGLNEATVRHKVTTTAGNEMWFQPEGDEDGNEERVASIKSHWIMAGMRSALLSMCRSLFATGDAAVYMYVEDDTIKYKVFSFENGEVFNMAKDATGQNVFVRRVNYGGVDTIEVYDKTNVSVWVKKPDSTILQKIVNQLRGANKEIIETSTDGYECIKRGAHGFKRVPVVYFRAKDVVWGQGQKTIERIERLLSDLAENNKYYAYQILFTSGGIISLPPADSMGKVISSEDPQGRAEILKPADASNTFTIDLEKNLDLLCETLALVIINPKELKAGENTGAFIRNLYWREVQWSVNTIAEIRPQLDALVGLFKAAVAKVEADAKFEKAKMSWDLEPCVPQNLSEEIQNLATAKNAGITSVETAAGEVPFNNPREYEKIQREMKEKSEADEQAKRLQAELTAKTTPIEPGSTGEGANNQGK